MKRNFFQFIAVAGVLLAGSLSASAAEHLRVNVPFSFVLAGLEFQPGKYTVEESNNGILTVMGEGRGAAVLTIPADLTKTSAPSSLRFVTDGHEYHLVGVQMDSETSRAVESETYREHRLSITSR
jgi:hypothetical protein